MAAGAAPERKRADENSWDRAKAEGQRLFNEDVNAMLGLVRQGVLNDRLLRFYYPDAKDAVSAVSQMLLDVYDWERDSHPEIDVLYPDWENNSEIWQARQEHVRGAFLAQYTIPELTQETYPAVYWPVDPADRRLQLLPIGCLQSGEGADHISLGVGERMLVVGEEFATGTLLRTVAGAMDRMDTIIDGKKSGNVALIACGNEQGKNSFIEAISRYQPYGDPHLSIRPRLVSSIQYLQEELEYLFLHPRWDGIRRLILIENVPWVLEQLGVKEQGRLRDILRQKENGVSFVGTVSPNERHLKYLRQVFPVRITRTLYCGGMDNRHSLGIRSAFDRVLQHNVAPYHYIIGQNGTTPFRMFRFRASPER